MSFNIKILHHLFWNRCKTQVGGIIVITKFYITSVNWRTDLTKFYFNLSLAFPLRTPFFPFSISIFISLWGLKPPMCPPPFAVKEPPFVRSQSRKPPLLVLKKITSLPCWLGWSRSMFVCASSTASSLLLLGIPLPLSLRCAAVVVATHGRRPPLFHLWLHQRRSIFVRCAASCTLGLGFHFLFPVSLPWLVACTALRRCFRYPRFRVSFSFAVMLSLICCLLPLLSLPPI